MLEKEIKILDIDVKNIQLLLLSFWAVKIFEWFIHDIYYDFENVKKWLTLDENKRLFRVRQKWDIHLYTIKRKISKNKDSNPKKIRKSDEHEREITDVVSFKKVLKKYWLKQIREKKKYRISYTIWDVQFDIDDYYLWDDKNIIAPLLEIESNSKKVIYERVSKLWLENHIIKKWWSRKLFKYYWVEYSWID